MKQYKILFPFITMAFLASTFSAGAHKLDDVDDSEHHHPGYILNELSRFLEPDPRAEDTDILTLPDEESSADTRAQKTDSEDDGEFSHDLLFLEVSSPTPAESSPLTPSNLKRPASPGGTPIGTDRDTIWRTLQGFVGQTRAMLSRTVQFIYYNVMESDGKGTAEEPFGDIKDAWDKVRAERDALPTYVFIVHAFDEVFREFWTAKAPKTEADVAAPQPAPQPTDVSVTSIITDTTTPDAEDTTAPTVVGRLEFEDATSALVEVAADQ